MIKHGEAPYLECSSAGDKRFSAFYARPQAWGGLSIEDVYQGSKIFSDGSTGLKWKEAKGRTPTNLEFCQRLYAKLWDSYIAENPDLLYVLMDASGLSDRFGKPGSVCQATELWRIRKKAIGQNNRHLEIIFGK